MRAAVVVNPTKLDDEGPRIAWAVLAADILMRRDRTQRVTRVQFRRLQVQLEHEQRWELDARSWVRHGTSS